MTESALALGVLWEIRDLLVEIRDAVAPSPEPVTDTCQHPEERRVDMSTFNDLHHWVCGVCRYDNKLTM